MDIVVAATYEEELLKEYSEISKAYSQRDAGKLLKISPENKDKQDRIYDEAKRFKESMVEAGELNDDIKVAVVCGNSLPSEDQTAWVRLVGKVNNGDMGVKDAIVEFRRNAPISSVARDVILYHRTSQCSGATIIDGEPINQLAFNVATAEENDVIPTIVLTDKSKTRFIKVSLHQECAKMVALVRAGKVVTVIAADAVRISANPMISAMILELFDATDTTLVLSRSIGKEHMEIVGLEEERKSERKIARQNKERSIEDEVEKLDDERKKGQNMKMNSI